MSSRWTILPYFRGKRTYTNGKKLGLTLALSVLALSACGESTPPGYAGSPATGTGSDTLKPVFAPPRANDSPPLPGTTGAPKTPDGLPAISATKGLNTNLFAAPIKDEIQRIERLENAVQELRNDFDSLSPAIVRLVAIEKDIQNLLSQLEILTGSAPAPIESVEEALLDVPAPAQPAPVPARASSPQTTKEVPQEEEKSKDTTPMNLLPSEGDPAAMGEQAPDPAPVSETVVKAPVQPPAAAAAANAPETDTTSDTTPQNQVVNSAFNVTALRSGLHPGKARLVFDLSEEGTYNTDLDNAEKILLIELPRGGWSAERSKNFAGHPLLSDYRIEAMSDGGTRVIFALRSISEILYSRMQKNADGTAKIIIDLKTP